VFEILLGLVVPLVLLVGHKRESPRAVAFAALLPLLGIFVTRFNFVLSGQMLSLRPVVGSAGQRMIYQPPFKGNTAGFLPYTPSIVEVLIVLGALALAVLIYTGGQRALRLEASPEEQRHE
jgi:molybdopterin-containing oxidoreductase family membrane subunit